VNHGGQKGRPRRHTNAVLAGCSVSVLVYGLGEWLSLPHAVAAGVTLGAAAAIALAAGLGSAAANWVVRLLGDLSNRVRRSGDRRAAHACCVEAAAVLDELIAHHEQALADKPKWVSERSLERKLIADYKARHRRRVQEAIREAHLVLTVPPEIIMRAAEPRSLGQLQSVCSWLRRVTDEDAAD
jgi:hypothetical protein